MNLKAHIGKVQGCLHPSNACSNNQNVITHNLFPPLNPCEIRYFPTIPSREMALMGPFGSIFFCLFFHMIDY
jgi:hypothetical protein